MSTATSTSDEISTFTIRKETQIAAPIEIAFEALLDELGPEGQGPGGESLSMKLEPWPGGRWYRDLGNNTGHLWGHVQVIKPPKLLEITGPLPMSYPVANHLQYRLKEENGGTLLDLPAPRHGPDPARASRRHGRRLGALVGKNPRTRRTPCQVEKLGPSNHQRNRRLGAIIVPATIEPTTDHEIAASFLAEFEQELVKTRNFLERIPADQLTWRPHEKSMSAGELALHIAEVPEGVLRLCSNDVGEVPNFGSGRPAPASLGDVLETLERSAKFVRETLPTMDDDRMQAIFTVNQNGKKLVAMPRQNFVRAIMLNHWYHHRGQLGVYLRLLGAKVPSSYGPSGDEMPNFDGN